MAYFSCCSALGCATLSQEGMDAVADPGAKAPSIDGRVTKAFLCG